MKKELFVNPRFNHLKSFTEQLPENFDNSGNTIFSGRNIVKEYEINGEHLVVKSFGRVNAVNKFIYAHFRKSKAARSYLYSMHLINNGFGSPEPVGYINCYDGQVLKSSYYICCFTDDNAVEALFHLPQEKAEEAVRALARFSHKLHKKGIYHRDFNNTNILFNNNNSSYTFSLIDNNRMRFGRYCYKRGIKHMQRITIPDHLLAHFAMEYSALSNKNSNRVLNDMLRSRAAFKRKRERKERFKKLLKLL